MSRTTECMLWLDSEDIYAIGKYYTKRFGWTYSDKELEALAEYYTESEQGDYVYDFNVKLIFEDHNCLIVDDIIEDYENNPNSIKFVCTNGKIIYDCIE